MDVFAVVVRGHAGKVVRAAFDDLDLQIEGDNTVLRGDLADQAALHGVLQKLQDYGIEIVEVRREPGAPTSVPDPE
jgi:hypothetical protein